MGFVGGFRRFCSGADWRIGAIAAVCVPLFWLEHGGGRIDFMTENRGTYHLTRMTNRCVSNSERDYPTVEMALSAADVVLGDGVDKVWIVDRHGVLILPEDQVRLRLHRPPFVAAEGGLI